MMENANESHIVAYDIMQASFWIQFSFICHIKMLCLI